MNNGVTCTHNLRLNVVSLLPITFPYIKSKSTLSIYRSVTTYVTTDAPAVGGRGEKDPSSAGRLQESSHLGFPLLVFCLGLASSATVRLPIQPLFLSVSELLNSFLRADFVGEKMAE